MAAKKKGKKEGKEGKKPNVNPELKGFNIEIDSFGEIKTNYDIDKINRFLNENVDDKKLVGREDIDDIKNREGVEDSLEELEGDDTDAIDNHGDVDLSDEELE